MWPLCWNQTLDCFLLHSQGISDTPSYPVIFVCTHLQYFVINLVGKRIEFFRGQLSHPPLFLSSTTVNQWFSFTKPTSEQITFSIAAVPLLFFSTITTSTTAEKIIRFLLIHTDTHCLTSRQVHLVRTFLMTPAIQATTCFRCSHQAK